MVYKCSMDKELCNRMKLLELIAEIGYWEFDLKTRKMLWSTEMKRIFGLNKENVPNKRSLIRNQIFPEDLPIYKSKLFELLKLRKPVNGNIRIKRKNDNKIIHCRFNVRVIKEDDKTIIVGTFQDITPMIEMDIKLEEAKNRAEQINMAKSYFIAQSSHDLRQPMQALKIFIHNLQEEDLNKRQQEVVRKIDHAASNLSSMLDNLLDLSRIEAGGFAYRNQDFNIKPVLEMLKEEFDATALSKGTKLRFVSCDCEIASDSILLERVLRNLLSNALKYAKSKVLFGCRKSKNGIKIVVADNGCGISDDEMKHIFNDFYQSDAIKDNYRNGAGLGLPIVKRLTEILAGKISVTSTLKKGSTFTLELPLTRKNKKP